MSDSGQKAIGRNRAPRVHISYRDPYNENANVELPFVVGVMADLSGNASDKAKPKVAERSFVDINSSNLNEVMAKIEPGVAMTVDDRLSETPGNKLGMKLTFRSMKDFQPDRIVAQVPAMKALHEAREQLVSLLTKMETRTEAQDLVRKLLNDPGLMRMVDQKSRGSSDESGTPETPVDQA
ncbi:MAG: type VI secretion system contractile sheath small subunit [Pararhodobacter sp.]